MPSAFRTYGGSSLPDEHADPADTQMSSMPSSSDSPGTPGKLTLRLCGRRASSEPFTCRSDTSARRAPEQTVAQGREPRRLGRHLRLRDLGGLPEADDAGHVERAGSQPPLVTAAVDQRLELQLHVAAAHVERADALRPVHLVRGHRRQIDRAASRRRTAPCRWPGPRRCGTARRARARSRRWPRSAAARRSRCWRPSPTRGSSGR